MNSLNHIDFQLDVLVESRDASGCLLGREVMQMEHDTARDVQDIFSQTMATSGPFQPSFPTGLPSRGAEVDLTSFGLDLSDVDLSAQPSASQPAERLDFQQLQPSGVNSWPLDVQVGHGWAGLTVGNPGPSASQSAGGLDFQQGQPAGATTWLQDAQVGYGSASAYQPDFFDLLPVAAQGAAQGAAPAAVGKQLEQASSQEDRDFGAFLIQKGHDLDQFPFEQQEQSSLPPNHRFRKKRSSRRLIYHKAAEQWDREKNGPLEAQTCGMKEVVWWKCEKDHEWQLSIHDRCRGDKPSSCPECKPRKKKITRYLKEHEAKEQWNEAKNGPIGEMTCGSHTSVWWKCEKDHEWQASIHARCRRDKPSPCPECKPRRKKDKRYLKEHAAKEQWNEAKNGPIGEMTCGLHKSVWWKCEKGHEWEASIKIRCNGEKPSLCPECKPRKKKDKRYLKDHAAKDQWDEDKNGPINNETCGMDRVVWWKCERDHEWQMSIHARFMRESPSACPECKTKKKKRAAEDSLEGEPAQKRQREESP
ncbi:MAG: hypothetical protein S4CHLAM81_11330 [Chlamydiales bacterium]|nr:hypothetical protein [Chlamydiales bacterium]MCH9635911.1 hypothetical protein [Chlamydiales bacterium]MCH9704329.1 zinc-ribbon domain-containing protein [Chlamydiota bacterium]